MHYRPIPLSGDADQKVVDIADPAHAGARSMSGPATSCLPATTATSTRRWRRCSVATGGSVCSVSGEFVNLGFSELTEKGLEIFDLEDDVKAFTSMLPRVRVIPIDEFDPVRFL